MSRWTVFGIGGMALVAAWAAVGGSVRAAGETEPEKERKEIRRVLQIGSPARLGVSLEDVQADDISRLRLGSERGALVKDVEADSPAATAGLKEGDVILSFDGETVRSAAQLGRLVRETPPGRKVSLEVSRDGATQRLTVALAERSARTILGGNLADLDALPPHVMLPDIGPIVRDAQRAARDAARDHTFAFRESFGRPGKLGLSYQEVSGQLARYFKVEDGGLLVAEVQEGGPAAQAGIKAGDVIVKFNGKAVHDSGDLHQAVTEAEAGSEATVTVQRDGRAMDVKVKLGGRASERPRSGARL